MTVPSQGAVVEKTIPAYQLEELNKRTTEYCNSLRNALQRRDALRCREGLADALILLSAHAEREGGICNCGTLTDRHAAACPAAPSAASGLADRIEQSKHFVTGVGESYTYNFSSGEIETILAALRSHQAPVGEDALQAALKALDAFDDDVDMEDYESVAGWWTKRGGPAAIALRECVAKLKQGES